MTIKVHTQHLSDFISENEYIAVAPQVKLAHETLHNGTGLGNDFLGWVTFLQSMIKKNLPALRPQQKKSSAIRMFLL